MERTCVPPLGEIPGAVIHSREMAKAADQLGRLAGFLGRTP